jgi:hypothetical protein
MTEQPEKPVVIAYETRLAVPRYFDGKPWKLAAIVVPCTVYVVANMVLLILGTRSNFPTPAPAQGVIALCVLSFPNLFAALFLITHIIQRYTITAEGVEKRSLFRRKRIAWSEVHDIRFTPRTMDLYLGWLWPCQFVPGPRGFFAEHQQFILELWNRARNAPSAPAADAAGGADAAMKGRPPR